MINPNAISTLGTLAENARSELEGAPLDIHSRCVYLIDLVLEIRIQITELTQHIKESFVDMRKHPYRLHAAFFHRGSAGGGHYWVYIYDHKKEVWRKYNDDRVSVVTNRNEIFGNPYTQGGHSANNPPPNPYLLIYLDAEKIDTLAETVKRDIVYPPPDHPPPVPARNSEANQMSAMPPHSSGSGSREGDVEMLEYVNGGEQAPTSTYHSSDAGAAPLHPNNPYSGIIVHPPPPSIPKEGDWDNSELITDRPIKW